MTDPQESARRMSGLKAGPWAPPGGRVHTPLPLEESMEELIKRDVISPETIITHSLINPDLRAHALFTKTMQPGLPPKRNKRRREFLRSLQYLSLLELAVQMDYLPVTEVWNDARQGLISSLWSEPARTFVETNNVLGVKALCRRVEFPLFPDLPVTTVFKDADARFACFLDHHREWLEDPYVNAWTDFLEGGSLDRSAARVTDLLNLLTEGSTNEPSAPLRTLVVGADQSTALLASLFEIAEGEEKPLFGAFYKEWFIDFFGLSRNSGDPTVLEPKNVNWAETFEQSDWFMDVKGKSLEHEGRESARNDFRHRLGVLQNTFRDTERYLAAHRTLNWTVSEWPASPVPRFEVER